MDSSGHNKYNGSKGGSEGDITCDELFVHENLDIVSPWLAGLLVLNLNIPQNTCIVCQSKAMLCTSITLAFCLM